MPRGPQHASSRFGALAVHLPFPNRATACAGALLDPWVPAMPLPPSGGLVKSTACRRNSSEFLLRAVVSRIISLSRETEGVNVSKIRWKRDGLDGFGGLSQVGRLRLSRFHVTPPEGALPPSAVAAPTARGDGSRRDGVGR